MGEESYTDVAEQLASLSKRIADLKAERARVEGRLQTIEKQRTEIHSRCKAIGVEPDELEEVIELREKTLYALLQSVDQAVSDIEWNRDQVYRKRDTQ